MVDYCLYGGGGGGRGKGTIPDCSLNLRTQKDSETLGMKGFCWIALAYVFYHTRVLKLSVQSSSRVHTSRFVDDEKATVTGTLLVIYGKHHMLSVKKLRSLFMQIS